MWLYAPRLTGSIMVVTIIHRTSVTISAPLMLFPPTGAASIDALPTTASIAHDIKTIQSSINSYALLTSSDYNFNATYTCRVPTILMMPRPGQNWYNGDFLNRIQKLNAAI